MIDTDVATSTDESSAAQIHRRYGSLTSYWLYCCIIYISQAQSSGTANEYYQRFLFLLLTSFSHCTAKFLVIRLKNTAELSQCPIPSVSIFPVGFERRLDWKQERAYYYKETDMP